VEDIECDALSAIIDVSDCAFSVTLRFELHDIKVIIDIDRHATNIVNLKSSPFPPISQPPSFFLL
jgi:hypothetical protein